MTSFEIANILYDLATDMDYADYEETREQDIDCLKLQLDEIKGSALYDVLETIAQRRTT